MKSPEFGSACCCRIRFSLLSLLLFIGFATASSLAQSVTILVNSGASQSIPSLISGTANNFPSPLSITTSWVSLKPGQTAVTLYGYFNSASAALAHTTTGNTVDIPSAAVKVRVNGAGSYIPFSSVVPVSGTASGATLIVQSISGFNKTGSRTDTFNLQIDLSGNMGGQNMTQLPPDTYSGTLRIQAQVTP